METDATATKRCRNDGMTADEGLGVRNKIDTFAVCFFARNLIEQINFVHFNNSEMNVKNVPTSRWEEGRQSALKFIFQSLSCAQIESFKNGLLPVVENQLATYNFSLSSTI